MNRSACLLSPRKIELRSRAPLVPGDMEAAIRVETAGICGTDLALYSGDYPVPLPIVPGHEFCGRVTATGPGVDPSWRGRRVVAEINNTCSAYRRATLCPACKRGMASHCQSRTVTGIIRRDGAFADEVVVPAGVLHAVPDGLDPAVAALTEPLAAALQTFVLTPVAEGDTVAVLGAGRLGSLIVLAARQQKSAYIAAVSRSREKRDRARAFGADETFHPEDAAQNIRAMTGGLGADIVVDATGSPDGLALALDCVRPGGVIAAKTTCGLPAQKLDLTRVVVDEVRIQGSRCGPFAPALRILADQERLLKTLISSIRPLDDIRAALEAATRESKVLLRMD